MLRRLFIPSLLIIATISVFWPATGFDFINWDDDRFIYKNPFITSPSPANTLYFWKESYKGLYIPLTTSAWSALAWLSQYMPAKPYGVNPALFHTANLLVHLLSVLVVFSITRMLLTFGFKSGDGQSGDPFKIDLAAGAGAIIFALHPLQVESVAWASELKDLLCGLFSFIAVREYLAFAFISSGARAAGTRAVDSKNFHYILACTAFLLALFSKPTAVVVPLVLFILDRYAVKRSFGKIAYSLAGWFAVAALMAVIAKSVQQSSGVIISTEWFTRPFIAGDALAFYFYKLVFPLQLGIDYGRTPEYLLNQWWGYLTWVIPFTLMLAIWFAKNREPLIASMGIFAASLLPVLGFVPFLFQTQSTVADHYLYIPMLGVALVTSLTVLKNQSALARVLFTLIIVLFGLRSSLQLPVWKNETNLYMNALKINPVSYSSHNNLGLSLAKRNRLDDAIIHFKTSMGLRPDKPDAYTHMGVALAKQGNYNQAIPLYKMALQKSRFYPNAHSSLGVALARQGKLDKAIKHYKKALELDPYAEMTHINLGVAYAKKGDFDKAVTHFSDALKIRPDFEIAKKYLEEAKARSK